MQLVLPVKEGKAPTEFSSGQTGFSPDGKTFLAICENTPQIHFGKQSLIECALRHLPCQSELAEATKIYIERKTRQEK